MHKPRPQEVYRHFRGRLYQVVTLAKHSETGEEMVVYQAMYGDFSIYCRPLWMFMEPVDTYQYPEADQTYRFQLMKPMRETLRAKPDKPSVPEVLKTSAHRADAKEHEDAQELSMEPATDADERTDAIERGVMGKTIEEEAQELGMDSRIVAFLDADSPEERLRILDDLHHDITDDQIDICAMAIDAKIPAGDLYDRYLSLRDLLLTRQRFESNRLRS